MMPATGPKISWCQTFISRRTFSRTVGGMRMPSPRPPVSRVAPPSRASVTHWRTRVGLLFQPESNGDIDGRAWNLSITFQAGMRSLMSIPLIYRDEVIGALQFIGAGIGLLDAGGIKKQALLFARERKTCPGPGEGKALPFSG